MKPTTDPGWPELFSGLLASIPEHAPGPALVDDRSRSALAFVLPGPAPHPLTLDCSPSARPSWLARVLRHCASSGRPFHALLPVAHPLRTVAPPSIRHHGFLNIAAALIAPGYGEAVRRLEALTIEELSFEAGDATRIRRLLLTVQTADIERAKLALNTLNFVSP